MRNIISQSFTILTVAFFLISSGKTEATEIEVFTLYRNVPSDQSFRVHVATFDAADSDEKGDEFYNLSNWKNCERAQKMFQAQPDWQDVKFWCEKGRFKK